MPMNTTSVEYFEKVMCTEGLEFKIYQQNVLKILAVLDLYLMN